MKIERVASGGLEVHLSRDSDHFYQLAELVRSALGGEWGQRLDNLDQSYWDIDVHGTRIVIHREHYLGVFVLCEDTPVHRELLMQHLSGFERMVTS